MEAVTQGSVGGKKGELLPRLEMRGQAETPGRKPEKGHSALIKNG